MRSFHNLAISQLSFESQNLHTMWVSLEAFYPQYIRFQGGTFQELVNISGE